VNLNRIVLPSLYSSLLSLALLAAPAPVLARYTAHVSGPDLGKAEGRCRANEPGPAILVDVSGLKDRRGLIKLEVYPANDDDFLADDSALVNAGKVFRRVEQPLNAGGPVTLCVRIPGPGSYSLVVLHDRDANHKFGWWSDGVGFAGNPKLGWHKPTAEATRITAGNGITRTTIVMNYRHGLGEAPIKHPHGDFW
jgi:uncharacterized protein (DUF2141 family)